MLTGAQITFLLDGLTWTLLLSGTAFIGGGALGFAVALGRLKGARPRIAAVRQHRRRDASPPASMSKPRGCWPRRLAWVNAWVKTNTDNGKLNEIYKKSHG